MGTYHCPTQQYYRRRLGGQSSPQIMQMMQSIGRVVGFTYLLVYKHSTFM